MLLALNIAKMAKGGFSGATIEELQHLIEKPHAKKRAMQKQGVVVPRYKEGKAAIESHLAVLCQNHRQLPSFPK